MQVNGKVRARLEVSKSAAKEEVEGRVGGCQGTGGHRGADGKKGHRDSRQTSQHRSKRLKNSPRLQMAEEHKEALRKY